MSGNAVMPLTEQLRKVGARLAYQGAHMELQSDGQLALVGLTPAQRQNIIVAWVGTWAAEWTRIDCPAIEVSYAEACLLTATTPPVDAEVRPPAAFWLIEVPRFIVVRNGYGELDNVSRLLCMHLGGLWSYTALAGVCELRCWQQSLEQMRLGAPGPDNDRRLSPSIPLDELDEVAYRLMARVVLNSAGWLQRGGVRL